MLRELRIRTEQWPLSRPFRISRGVKSVTNVIVVDLRDEDTGSVGQGEGVPYVRYNEDVSSVVRQIESLRPALTTGLSRRGLLERLPAGAARNAIDCALWDLEAQTPGAEVAHLLRQPPLKPLTTALTISLDTPAAMRSAARLIATEPLVKVKVDATDPAAQIRAVREACPQSELIVDPNESWNIEVLRDLKPALLENRIALLEQPLPATAEDALEGFESSIPICADESCHTPADLARLRGRFQFVNIKLDKTGGLTAAMDLLWQARSQGFGVMVGCMICTSLSIAAALHVARHARFVDLDGPLWLACDRAGGVSLREQRLQPPQAGFWGEPHTQRTWAADP